jgi:hypothetical protein
VSTINPVQSVRTHPGRTMARLCRWREVTPTSRGKLIFVKYKNQAALSSPIEGEDVKESKESSVWLDSSKRGFGALGRPSPSARIGSSPIPPAPSPRKWTGRGEILLLF